VKVDCLTIGSTSDTHVISVVHELKGLGASTFVIDQADLTSSSFSFIPQRRGFSMGDIHVESASVIWLRRFHPGTVGGLSAADAEFAKKEYTGLLLGALATLDAEWHSPPNRLTLASHKPLQLALAARDRRLRVPKTLVTSCPVKAADFIATLPDGCIFKSVGGHVIEHRDGFEPIYTSMVTKKVTDSLELLKLSPCTFQEYIERDYDVRLNVIGNSVFAATIDTREFPEAKADCRKAYYNKARHACIEPEPEIAQACLAMCEKLEVSFGAFDFAVDRRGDWFFLEMNPWGQWAWIEETTGQPLSAAFAHYFVSRMGERSPQNS